MIACSRDTELRLAHNTGMLDGMILTASMINGCMGCEESRAVRERIWDVTRHIAENRAKMLLHMAEEKFSLEKFVDGD